MLPILGIQSPLMSKQKLTNWAFHLNEKLILQGICLNIDTKRKMGFEAHPNV